MNTNDIIKKTCMSQPEGEKLLDTIMVSMSSVQDQYTNCMYMQKVVAVKFDENVLRNGGYSLRQILDASTGIVHDEVQRFVLEKLQRFILKRDEENKPQQNG